MVLLKKDETKSDEKIRLLAQDQERFKHIFEESAVGESIVDLEGHWLDANERLCKILGYSKKELLSKEFKDVTYPDDVKESLVLRDSLVSGKTSSGQLQKRYIRKDGSIVWVLLSISLCRDEKSSPFYFVVHTQDITEFKKNEQELFDLKEKYSTIIENGNDGIVVIQDFLTKFANTKMLELTGYTVKEIQDKPFLSFIDPEFIDLVKKNYADRVAGKEIPQRYELKILKKSDGSVPAEISGSLINFGGKPADMVFIRDISEKKQREEELEKFKFIVQQSDQQIGLANLDGTIVYVNEAFAKNHGYAREELIGMNFSSLHPKEEQENVRENIKNLSEFGKDSREILHERKDGSIYLTFMDNFILNIDSKPKYIVGMAVDITKLKESEKEVVKQKSLLDSIVSSTKDAILVVDRDGKVVFYNNRFKDFWRIPEELIKTKDDKKLLGFVVDQLADPEGFINTVNYLYLHVDEESTDIIKFKDGRIFDRTSLPQKIENEVVGRIWSFRDVTDKAKLDENEKKRVHQIERINKLAVGRELKMIELKKEIEVLKKKISQ